MTVTRNGNGFLSRIIFGVSTDNASLPPGAGEKYHGFRHSPVSVVDNLSIQRYFAVSAGTCPYSAIKKLSDAAGAKVSGKSSSFKNVTDEIPFSRNVSI